MSQGTKAYCLSKVKERLPRGEYTVIFKCSMCKYHGKKRDTPFNRTVSQMLDTIGDMFDLHNKSKHIGAATLKVKVK